MRLDKVIEYNLQTSRKAMKRLFLMKKVRVDGVIEENPQRNVDASLHRIEVDGRILATDEVYYIMNKPQGILTANHDLKHQTVIDLLAPKDQKEGIYAIGRLDRDTEGLILLTNNGQLGYDLLHPTKKVSKVYEAVVNEVVTEEDVRAFQAGIVFEGGAKCQSAQLRVLAIENGHSKIRLEISEGKFHQVKKMFLARGKKVIFLKRTAIGPIRLPSDLAVGAYRSLNFTELRALAPYFR